MFEKLDVLQFLGIIAYVSIHNAAVELYVWKNAFTGFLGETFIMHLAANLLLSTVVMCGLVVYSRYTAGRTRYVIPESAPE